MSASLSLFLCCCPASLVAVASKQMPPPRRPPVRVVPDVDVNLLTVEHPEQFALAAATSVATASKLVVTGTVSPDISRNIPVASLASGRIAPRTKR